MSLYVVQPEKTIIVEPEVYLPVSVEVTQPRRYNYARPGEYDRYNVEEVMSAIDFPVVKHALWYKDEQGTVHQSQSYNIIRADGGAELGYGMTEDYQLITHGQALEPALQALHDKNFTFRNVLLKNAGGRIMIEACAPNSPVEINGEEHIPRVIVKNSYDASTSISVQFGLYRMVCTNGIIQPAFKGSTVKFNTRHSGNAIPTLNQWQQAFETYNWVDALKTQLEALGGPAQFDTAQKILAEVFGTTVEKAHENKHIKKAMYLARHGQGQENVTNMTLWNLYNGITEALRDNVVSFSRNNSDNQDGIFSRNDLINKRASKALELILQAA